MSSRRKHGQTYSKPNHRYICSDNRGVRSLYFGENEVLGGVPADAPDLSDRLSRTTLGETCTRRGGYGYNFSLAFIRRGQSPSSR